MPTSVQERIRDYLSPAPTLLWIGSIAWKAVAALSNVDFLLSIRSEIFFVIFMFFVSHGWWVLALIGVVWALFSRRSPHFTLNPTMMVVIGVLAFVWGVLAAVYATGSVPTVISGWGVPGRSCGGVVDTTRLVVFRKNYDITWMCGIADARRDKLEDSAITISGRYSIVPNNVSIESTWQKDMDDEVKKTIEEIATRTNTPIEKITIQLWNEVVLVPKNVDLRVIHRLSDVPRHGGKILREGLYDL